MFLLPWFLFDSRCYCFSASTPSWPRTSGKVKQRELLGLLPFACPSPGVGCCRREEVAWTWLKAL